MKLKVTVENRGGFRPFHWIVWYENETFGWQPADYVFPGIHGTTTRAQGFKRTFAEAVKAATAHVVGIKEGQMYGRLRAELRATTRAEAFVDA